MQNFDWPLHSKSIGEFWRRWHISLSTWFFDYVFNPLVILNRNWGRNITVVFALLVTFVLSGFWHGAGWTYILWGVMQGGVPVIFEYLTRNQRKELFEKLPQWLSDFLSHFLTFTYLVLTWILFRANNLNDAFYIYGKLFSIPDELAKMISTRHFAIPKMHNLIMPSVILILFLELGYVIQSKFQWSKNFNKLPGLARWVLYFSGLLLIFCYGIHPAHQFIYFQF